MIALFVGFALNSVTHDYGGLRAALLKFDARRVSRRVWLISMEGNHEPAIAKLEGAVAPGDRVLIEEFPATLNLQVWRERPEFNGPLPPQMRSRSMLHK